MNNRPLLIVISSNRNYGWIVPAFLKANTRWADYIVITDQMSTDGSRDMYAQYKNVIVVDDKDMQFKENTRARMAFEKGREIAEGGDAIFFALDIDEILPANWMETDDGTNKKAFTLNRPYQGLLIKPGIWRTLTDFSSGSICMVLANEKYNEKDYIRSYEEFVKYRFTNIIKK